MSSPTESEVGLAKLIEDAVGTWGDWLPVYAVLGKKLLCCPIDDRPRIMQAAYDAAVKEAESRR